MLPNDPACPVFLNPQVWLLVCYLSPCASLPPPDHVAALSAANPQLMAWVYFESPASLFPQLWCPEGSYSKWGQLFFMPIDVSGLGQVGSTPHTQLVCGAAASDRTWGSPCRVTASGPHSRTGRLMAWPEVDKARNVCGKSRKGGSNCSVGGRAGDDGLGHGRRLLASELSVP